MRHLVPFLFFLLSLCNFFSFYHAILLPLCSFLYPFVVGADVVDRCLGPSCFFPALFHVTNCLY